MSRRQGIATTVMERRSGPAACHSESQTHESGAGERKEVCSSVSHLRRWGHLVSKSILTSQFRQSFYKEGEGKQNKEIKGRG